MQLAAGLAGSGSRVLVVDDDPLLLSSIGRTLKRAGIAQVQAANGLDALECLRAGSVDVVVTDYDMPDLNGLELIERAPAGVGAPVFVLLTGVDGLDLSRARPNDSVVGVLRKPVDEQELLETISAARQLHRRRSIAPPRPVSVLLLEDDADDVALFKAYCKRMTTPVDIHHCTALADAVDAAMRSDFDVAVVDLNTADAHGLDPLRKLRMAAPSMALVVLTHRADDALAEQAFSMGAQEYLVKRRCTSPQLESALRRAYARKESEQQLVHIATHDPLTDLANGDTLRTVLRHRVDQARRGGASLGLIYLDLDGFKRVNDVRGHAVGDEVLKHVGRCLSASTREGDLAARLGGDEFALLLTEVSDPNALRQVGLRLIEAIEQPVPVRDGDPVTVSASVGVAACPRMAREADELLSLADEGMYLSKASGGGTVRAVRSVSTRMPMAGVEQELRASVRESEFQLALQPQQPLHAGRPLTLEALLRWPRHPDVSPRKFVPWLEEMSLLDSVSSWVLDRACRELVRLLASGIDARVSVNVASRLLRQESFRQWIAGVIHSHDLDPDRVELEVREPDAPLDDPDFVHAIQCLRTRIGVRIMLDHYGAGAASLTALHACPIDGIKLHRSFMRTVASDERVRLLLEGLVFTAHRLGLHVVAEGVETEEQLACARELHCDAVQGFLLARPQILDS